VPGGILEGFKKYTGSKIPDDAFPAKFGSRLEFGKNTSQSSRETMPSFSLTSGRSKQIGGQGWFIFPAIFPEVTAAW